MALLLRSLAKREGVKISDLPRDDLLTAASWTEFLPEAERGQFVEEITRLAVASVESGVLTPIAVAATLSRGGETAEADAGLPPEGRPLAAASRSGLERSRRAPV